MTLLSLIDIAPFNWMSIGITLFCGASIGLERQVRGKPVGIRTSCLIILGTYMFVTVSNNTLIQAQTADPSRIIGQIITGVGFLGAGVMMTRDGVVFGVTSAATIWVLAATGVSIALGHHSAAIKTTIIVLIILNGVEVLERSFHIFTRGVHKNIRTWKKKPHHPHYHGEDKE